MNKEVIALPDAPKLPFSSAIKAGGYIFISGQIGYVNNEGRKVEGIKAQTRQCLKNIERILEIAGASLDDVVKVTVFLANINDFAKMNEVYQDYFPKEPPARSTVITGLVRPEMLAEIECIAYRP